MPYIWSLFLDGYPLHCSGIWQNLWLSMDTKQACVMIRLDCVVKTWSTFKFNHYHHDREDLCVTHLKRETNQFSLWPLTTFLMTLNFDRNDNLRKSPSPNRVTQSGFHRWSGRFLGITTGWDPSVCKSNRLCVHILQFFSFIELGYIIQIPLTWTVIFLQSWTNFNR